MSQRQRTFTTAQALQMLDSIDDEYEEEYLKLPTPIEPLIHDDSSSSHAPALAEPLFHEDSSYSTPTAHAEPLVHDDSSSSHAPALAEPLSRDDSSYSTPVSSAEPLIHDDSSSSHETPTLDIRRSWSNAGEDVEETDDVPKKRKRKSDPSTWKRNIIMQ